ncbi:MAG: S8 family peptidase [Bacteroidota bacterium]
MRRAVIHALIFITIVLTGIPAFAQSDYYWYQGKKIGLRENPNKRYILLEPFVQEKSLQQSFNVPTGDIKGLEQTRVLNSLRPFGAKQRSEKNWTVLDIQSTAVNIDALTSPGIIYQAPFFFTESGVEAGLSHLFHVKLNDAKDIDLLIEMAATNRVEILGNNKFMPLWYTLSCTNRSAGNALEMANLFYESVLFSASEPDLMVDDSPECVNDTFFNNQWGLNNTGQNGGTAGIDINACDAWNTTTGNANVVVAVLDHGIELNHPDMPNISPLSFDSESGTSPSLVLGSHGTACAGIIGAAQGNSLGVSGVAPNIELMSISNSLAGSPNSRQRRADGINWAWQNGADVISNSWISGVQYQIIDDAIDDALALGRGGLGTIIVFASGNANGAVSYPANSNPDIIAVGAMSPCGERKNPGSCDGEFWGSNFGNELDVVAPGVLIPTTDRQGGLGYAAGDYTQNFNGTSSACPHVAGVAGLILSVNPNLTQQQVSDIIESTAQKVGGYNYQTTGGRPNGTWNNEMGYGLLDAEAAVLAADPVPFNLFLQNDTETGTVVHEAENDIEAGYNVTTAIPFGDYIIASSAVVTLRAGNRIRLANGFHARSGSQVKIEIGAPQGGSAAPSKPLINTKTVASTQVPLQTVSTETTESNVTNAERIYVYPNPLSAKAEFNFEVVEEASVTLQLMDVDGRVINTLINDEKRRPGTYTEELDGSDLPDGLYFFHFINAGEVTTGKIVIRR